MKPYNFRAALFTIAIYIPSLCSGQEAEKDERKTCILGGISDGRETPVAVQKPARLRTADSRILSTIRKRQNGRMVTIHQVEPPAPLPIPRRKAPAPEVAPEDNPLLRNTPVFQPMRTIGVSSTTYRTGDEVRTRLTLHYENKNYHAWSNIDFRHMEGFTAYRANGRDYFFLLGTGLARDTKGKTLGLKDAYKAGCPRRFSPTGSRANFILTSASKSDNGANSNIAREILEDMHTLYRTEKSRLTAAHQSRLAMAAINARRAKERREAPPKDITIRFWKRDVQKERARLQQHAAQEGESK